MSKKYPSNCHLYRITIEGHLDDRWVDWFEGMTMTQQRDKGDITLLTGLVADQAALRGLLNQIWDFNLAVIAVERIEESNR